MRAVSSQGEKVKVRPRGFFSTRRARARFRGPRGGVGARPAIVEFAFSGWRRFVALGSLLGRESPRRSAEARGRRRSEAGAAMRLCRCQRRRKGKGVRGRHRARGNERHERSTDGHGGVWAAVTSTRGVSAPSVATLRLRLAAIPCQSVAAGARIGHRGPHAKTGTRVAERQMLCRSATRVPVHALWFMILAAWRETLDAHGRVRGGPPPRARLPLRRSPAPSLAHQYALARPM